MDVLLRVDPQDGNDPIEASVSLAVVPRKGDSIELWDAESGFINSATEKRPAPNWSGESVFGEVEGVVLCGYAPERVEVWLRFDSFDLEQVRRVLKGIEEGMAP